VLPAYSVFISHSLGWGDDLLIAQACEQLGKRHGVDCRMALRTWKVGPSAIGELEERIAAVDCVLAVVTNDGTAASYVNQELGIANARRKPVVAIIETSVYMDPLLDKVPDLIPVNFEAPPDEFAHSLFSRLAALDADPRVAIALYWAAIATVGEIFLSRG
jgi:hypothetical protein